MPSCRLICCAISAWICDFIRYTLPGGHIIWPYIDVFLLMLVDFSRLFCGHGVANGVYDSKRPEKPLILYEFEGCPFCRKVRETLSTLDIDYYCYPCPRETLLRQGVCLNSKFRPQVLRNGGKLQFPYLEDPNTGRKLYESDKIVAYLWQEYGDKATPKWNYKVAHHPTWFKWSALFAGIVRPCNDMGMLRTAAHGTKEPLELWGYESSPYVRRVREKLSLLELPYLYHQMPHGSKKKREDFRGQYEKFFGQKALRDKLGLVQVPMLKDANAGITELFESAEIVKFLINRYQTVPPPPVNWLQYGSEDKKTQ